MNNPIQPRLGIDIGRVIISNLNVNHQEDTVFLSGSEAQAMQTPPMANAFEVIQRLVIQFEGRVWLVSKCGNKIRDRSRKWLAHHNFYQATGMSRHQVRFCYKRPEKAGHARELGLTHFIDDRVDVLDHLRGLVPNLYLFGPQTMSKIPKDMIPTPDWRQVAEVLLPQPALVNTNEAAMTPCSPRA